MAVDGGPSSSGLRRGLYALLEDDRPTIARIREALQIGRDHLEVESGYVLKHGPDGTNTVTVSVNSEQAPNLIVEGSEHPHTQTYCRRTVEEPTPVAVSNASEQGWGDDPAYEAYGLECYLGASVFVRGEVYGTVCFVARAAMDRTFEDGEKAFVELLARTVGRLLETADYEAELSASHSRSERFRAKYRTLVETVPDAAILADTETGAIVEVNETATELVGYDAATLREMTVADLHDDDAVEKHRRLFEWFLEHQGARTQLDDGSQITLQDSDGTAIPVEVSANAVDIDGTEYVLGLFRDISDRLAHDAELRVFQRAIDEAAIGITFAEADGGKLPLTYANEEFRRITGYDQTAALGRNCNFLQGEATDPEAVDRIRAALDAEEPIEEELLNYRADGTPFWNRLTITPVTAADDETISHYVDFQQDVTARMRREELIRVLNRLLRHNLRNELTAVGGYADILTDRLGGESAELAGRIQESATTLSTLAEKAQSLERVMHQNSSLEAYDLVDAVESVVADLREQYPAVTFAIDTPASVCVVGHAPLKRAIEELCTNAATHGTSPVEVCVTEENGGVTLTISDAGEGLSALEQEVIEEGTETPLKHSLGVGLWLVNWIVTGVGGTVTTSVDDGTIVTLRFTAIEDEASGVPARYRRAALNTGSNTDPS